MHSSENNFQTKNKVSNKLHKFFYLNRNGLTPDTCISIWFDYTGMIDVKFSLSNFFATLFFLSSSSVCVLSISQHWSALLWREIQNIQIWLHFKVPITRRIGLFQRLDHCHSLAKHVFLLISSVRLKKSDTETVYLATFLTLFPTKEVYNRGVACQAHHGRSYQNHGY